VNSFISPEANLTARGIGRTKGKPSGGGKFRKKTFGGGEVSRWEKKGFPLAKEERRKGS